jgi:hypothetical protein
MHDLTARHLRLCATRWSDLTDALATTGVTSWPPAGRVSDYLSALDQADAELAEAAAWQAQYARQYLDRDPQQIGATRPPLRIVVLDTMRSVEQLLVNCADAVAAEAERPPMPMAPAEWPDADRARRDALARADAADPRRWRWGGRRTAVYAALWLVTRTEGHPGPFAPLTPPWQRYIAGVAATCAGRIEQALDITARTAAVAHPCPGCGGQIEMRGGAGTSPVARCTRCGTVWTGRDTAVA